MTTKKIILSTVAILMSTMLSITTYAQSKKDSFLDTLDYNRIEISNIIETSIRENQSLFAFLTEQFTQYYNRSEFSDPNQTTGWYRVDRFLKWIKNNEKELQNSQLKFTSSESKKVTYSLSELIKEISNNNVSLELKNAFWIYLGARYVEDIYKVNCDFSDFEIIASNSFPAGNAVNPSVPGRSINIGIGFNPRESFTIPQTINLGIHETTHILPYLINKDLRFLTEKATFYSQYNFALPVIPGDIQTYAHSTRDIRRLHFLRSDIPFIKEYNDHIVGIILNKQFTLDKVLNFISHDEYLFPTKITIIQAVYGISSAKNNSFMYGSTALMAVTPENVKLFNKTIDDIRQWFINPAMIIDLGELEWPNQPNQTQENAKKTTVNVIFSKTTMSFVGGLKRINEDQFFELMFGEFANEPKLHEFYDKLISYLPSDMQRVISEIYSPMTPYEYYGIPLSMQYFDNKILQDAILRALNDVTDDTAPVPEGYL